VPGNASTGAGVFNSVLVGLLRFRLVKCGAVLCCGVTFAIRLPGQTIFDLASAGKGWVSWSHAGGMVRYPDCRVLMRGGAGQQSARRGPAAVAAQPCPPSPLTRRQPARPRLDRSPAAGNKADLDVDAYIARVVLQAPPLSSQQRDKLALILNSHRLP
jgi:hypothetical protein